LSSMDPHSDVGSVRTPVEIVYCFDFDGVLCDTMDESLITSYNAYFGGEAKSVSEIDSTLRDFFYAHRYLVRPAGEYHLLFHAFQRGETVIGKDRFLQLKAAHAQEMKDHAERFYAYRKRFQKDLRSWERLHRVFPQCIDFLEKRRHPFFIVTNKDKDSVLTLARHGGFLDRIIEIYSREMSIDKRLLMEKLMKDHGLNPSTHLIVYVDDHEGTLGEMKDLPLDLYLASWGYTGKPESSSFRLIQSLSELP
jgi:phosphoglycolate phosphatase-like HAD superfamily hydrolase